jgi:dUTPase
MITLTYEKLYPEVIAPIKKHDSDFCYDIRAYFSPGQRILTILDQDSTGQQKNYLVPFKGIDPEDNQEKLYIEVPVGNRVLIPTGIKAQLNPEKLYLAVKTEPTEEASFQYMPVTLGTKMFIRSGIAKKRGLYLANSVGIIDCQFPEQWEFIVQTSSFTSVKIWQGERLAQIQGAISVDLNIVEGKVESKERLSGFGSTGTN